MNSLLRYNLDTNHYSAYYIRWVETRRILKMLVMNIQLCLLLLVEVFDLALLTKAVFGGDFPVFKK